MKRDDSARFSVLLTHEQWPSVSIFMPTVRGGSDVRQNPVRLRNLLNEAQTQLQQRGMPTREIDRLLEYGRSLIDDVEFWRHNQQGLALFIAEGVFEALRVPRSLHERLVVARRFHITPMVPMFESRTGYYALMLSQNLAQLCHGDWLTLEPMDVQGLPTSLDEVLAADELEESLQFHTQTGPQGPEGGNRPAVFHGHGVGTDAARHKKRVTEFCRIVNQAVAAALHGHEKPLVLCGVNWVIPVYHDINTYPHLIEQAVVGNFDHAPMHELHERTLAVVEPALSRHREAALRLYQEAHGTPRAIDDLREVVIAAAQGRVSTLLAVPDADVWGRFDPARQTAEMHEQRRDEDENLLDLAVLFTLRNSGEVHHVDASEIAGARPAAAVLRY